MEDYVYLSAAEKDFFLAAITDDRLRESLRHHYLHAAHVVCTVLAGKASFEKLEAFYRQHLSTAYLYRELCLDKMHVEVSYPDEKSVRWKGRSTRFAVNLLSELPTPPWQPVVSLP